MVHLIFEFKQSILKKFGRRTLNDLRIQGEADPEDLTQDLINDVEAVEFKLEVKYQMSNLIQANLESIKSTYNIPESVTLRLPSLYDCFSSRIDNEVAFMQSFLDWAFVFLCNLTLLGCWLT